MSLSPPPTAPSVETRSTLKWHIATLEEKNAELVSKMIKTPIHSYVREGRAIRRLVSLTDPVADLIAEHDRRVMLVDNGDEIESLPSSDLEERTFRSYKKLIQWCPSVKELMKSSAQGYQLAVVCQDLRKGADAARGDDASTLKTSVASWLNEQHPHPEPLLVLGEKQERGFNHNMTGKFLCPVDYDWLDATVREAIRDYHPQYPVTAYMWPAFLYRRTLYDPERPSNGLFRGELLVRTFRCIFTSPSSARKESEFGTGDMDDHPHLGRACKAVREVRTRCNVAGLLKMRSVQPRAIAYTAIQLCFALSSSTSWDLKDDNFDYEAFYYNIVDWFERPRSQSKAREVEELLLWWNRHIFGHRHTSAALQSQQAEKLSVAISMA